MTNTREQGSTKNKEKRETKTSPLYKKINREKVFDHDHLLEKDNGICSAHRYCNIQRQTRRFFIPVFIHNGSNYDFHLFVRELIYHNEHNILPIAKSAYNFIKFDWRIFRFIDTRRFLNGSEEKLADQLAKIFFHILVLSQFPSEEGCGNML